MRFDVSIKKITVDELIAAEESTRATKELMAKFLVTDEGEPIEFSEALEKLNLPLDEFGEISEDFLRALRRAKSNGRR